MPIIFAKPVDSTETPLKSYSEPSTIDDDHTSNVWNITNVQNATQFLGPTVNHSLKKNLPFGAKAQYITFLILSC